MHRIYYTAVFPHENFNVLFAKHIIALAICTNRLSALSGQNHGLLNLSDPFSRTHGDRRVFSVSYYTQLVRMGLPIRNICTSVHT